MAAALRLTAVGWDGYEHYQPDERYIAWVGSSIEWPADLRDALDPRRSTLNPYYWPADARSPGIVLPQAEPRRFAYGHLPLYAGVLGTRLAERLGRAQGDGLPASGFVGADLLNGAERPEFDHLVVVGRVLTALVDVASVALLYLLSRRLASPTVGLLAASLLALNVMHVQLAHFWTVDPFITFFALLALYAMVRSADQPHWLWLAGVAIGLAVGSKFAGVFLFFPLLVAVWLMPEVGPGVKARRLAGALGLALLAFALTNPFAVLDFTCLVTTPALKLGPWLVPEINWGSCFVENVARQSAMVSGELDLPFARQYAGTTPFLYFLEMQFKWGMGPLLALAAFGSLTWMLARLGPRRRHALVAGEWILLAWIIPYFLFTGPLMVKFMRYLQPIAPSLMLVAALGLRAIPWPRWRGLAVGLVVVGTSVYALAFVNLYQAPHPWLDASAWIYDNVPAGATILGEQWDESLPSSLTLEGERASPSRYHLAELTWLSGTESADDLAKLRANLELLAAGDLLVLASNRIYGVVPRLPERYPLSSQAHALLFSGALGYDVVYVTDRGPQLGPWRIQADTFAWSGLTPPPPVLDYLAAKPSLKWGRADESFTVYDQPLTIVLANSGHLSPEALLDQFDLTANEDVHEP